jgi:DNA-directed RNA polymerase subunit RPC12/RpoP
MSVSYKRSIENEKRNNIKYKCPLCIYNTSSFSRLKDHENNFDHDKLTTVLNKHGKHDYSCNECGYRTVSKARINKHLNKHRNKNAK